MDQQEKVLNIIKKKCPWWVYTFVKCELDEKREVERLAEAPEEQEENIQKREVSFLDKLIDLQTIPNTFYDIIPESGEGDFSYQHHYYKLDGNNNSLNDHDLMKSGADFLSILRFEAQKDQSFQFALGTGDNLENFKCESLDKFLEEKKCEYMPLRMDSAKMLMRESDSMDLPLGDYNCSPNCSGACFCIEKGRYKVGVVHRDFFEVFLKSAKLNGRFIFTRKNDQRFVEYAEDQTPFAEKQNKNTYATALKLGGHKSMLWGSPTQKPELIDLLSPSMVDIIKSDEEKRIVYGVVLDPYQDGGGDAHGDYISPAEIERTAHNFMKKSRVISFDHKELATAEVVESFIEQYPSREDYKKAINGMDHSAYKRSFGNDVIHSGAWILGTQLSPELWDKFKSGEINAYSIEGFGNRKPITIDRLPRIKFVDLLPFNS